MVGASWMPPSKTPATPAENQQASHAASRIAGRGDTDQRIGTRPTNSPNQTYCG